VFDVIFVRNFSLVARRAVALVFLLLLLTDHLLLVLFFPRVLDDDNRFSFPDSAAFEHAFSRCVAEMDTVKHFFALAHQLLVILVMVVRQHILLVFPILPNLILISLTILHYYFYKHISSPNIVMRGNR
jgi:hypothetical protein